MTLLAIWVSVLASPLLLSWAAGLGRRQLWSAAAAALLFVVGAALVLGRTYSVPDPLRVALAGVLLLGPGIILATILLGRTDPHGGSFSSRIGPAFLGTIFGFAIGWVAVVYGLGVW